MPRQKKATLTQATLTNFLSSSPPRPKATSKSSTKSRARSARSRTNVGSSSPSQRQAKFKTRGSDEFSESDSGSDVAKIRFEPVKPVTQPSSKSEAHQSEKTQRKQPSRIVISDDDDDEAEASNKGKRNAAETSPLKRKNVQRTLGFEESDSEDESPKGHVRRRVVKRQSSSSEEDILDGIDDEKIVGTRLRTHGMSKFQQSLERLKRKKRGQALSESDEGASDHVDGDSDVQPFADARPDDNESENSQSGEEDLDTFIVDDVADSGHISLPSAFSMDTHQDLAHHFKIICQYFVHLALATVRNKASTSKQLLDDDYFSLPLSIVRRKLSGVRDSVASSKWQPSFSKALKSLPEFTVATMDVSVPQCDACHLGGRISTYVGRLSGRPYDPATFQPLEDADSDDTDGSDDEQCEDNKREFHLGRFCARRTKTYHELSHWEHALYTQLGEELNYLRTLNKSHSSDSLSDTLDDPDGDSCMEKLDKRGVIDMEWNKIREVMERATKLDAETD